MKDVLIGCGGHGERSCWHGCSFDYGQTGRRSWAETEQITRKAGRKDPRETDRVFLVPATISAPVKIGFVS